MQFVFQRYPFQDTFSSAALSEMWRLYLVDVTKETPVTVGERHGYIPRVHAQHLYRALLPIISEGTLGEQKTGTLLIINMCIVICLI